jgi:dihydroorotate dehydrogenase (fumarate)
VLLRHGPRILSGLLGRMTEWLTEHGYENLDQVRGAMNLQRCPDPAAFERANYIKILQSWRV